MELLISKCKVREKRGRLGDGERGRDQLPVLSPVRDDQFCSPGWSPALAGEPGVREYQEITVRVQISIKNDIPGLDGERNR